MKASDFPIIHENLSYPEDAHIFRGNEGAWRIRYYNENTGRSFFGALSRYVWSFFNGPIPDGWVIHHRNSDALDNHLENLEAMPWSEHSWLHRTHPEYRSQLYVDYHAANPGKEHAKYEKYVAPKRQALRLAVKVDS